MDAPYQLGVSWHLGGISQLGVTLEGRLIEAPARDDIIIILTIACKRTHGSRHRLADRSTVGWRG